MSLIIRLFWSISCIRSWTLAISFKHYLLWNVAFSINKGYRLLRNKLHGVIAVWHFVLQSLIINHDKHFPSFLLWIFVCSWTFASAMNVCKFFLKPMNLLLMKTGPLASLLALKTPTAVIPSLPLCFIWSLVFLMLFLCMGFCRQDWSLLPLCTLWA